MLTIICVLRLAGLKKFFTYAFYLFRDAFAYVYSRRGCVTPYESFLQQLCELEPILKARADVEKAAAEAGTAGAGADPR